jgi:hypothetical protein
MRRLVILAVVLAGTACTSTPQTAPLSQTDQPTTCRTADDGTTVCQPTRVSYQKSSARYSAR